MCRIFSSGTSSHAERALRAELSVPGDNRARLRGNAGALPQLTACRCSIMSNNWFQDQFASLAMARHLTSRLLSE
jgi:hypothetical protein